MSPDAARAWETAHSLSGDDEILLDFWGAPRKRVPSENTKIGKYFGEVARKVPEANKLPAPVASSYLRRPPAASLPPACLLLVLLRFQEDICLVDGR